MVNKPVAILLIAVSLLAVFSPISFSASSGGGGAMLMTLDVCHGSTGFLSSVSEMPVIHEATVNLAGYGDSICCDESSFSLYQMLAVFERERPPKA